MREATNYEPLPPSFHEEAGVSYYLHRRSFCAEEGGLLPLDEFIGSLLDGSSKQHRRYTDGAVQLFYYFLLTQSVDMFVLVESKTPDSSPSFTPFRGRETSREKC
jgi:hypothetical protein